jgi:hypothetical protein
LTVSDFNIEGKKTIVVMGTREERNKRQELVLTLVKMFCYKGVQRNRMIAGRARGIIRGS